jgi:hypothetical protein
MLPREMHILLAHTLRRKMTYLSGNINMADVTKSEPVYSSNNITITASDLKPNDRPWMAYYVTADEFFEVLRIAYDDTYGGGSDTPWHPEDMYVNVSCVLEVVTNTLSNMAKLRSGRQVKGIKES